MRALLALGILGWSGFSFWARLESPPAAAAASWWAAVLFEWLVPVFLLILIGQLAIRTGRAEQSRFADAAAMLAGESTRLEARLSVVNRELSLAREFLAAQARDLEALGRVASERLAATARTLDALIARNTSQLGTISEIGSSAVANMERLRDQLPVIANASRDMTNQIGNTGKIAQERAEALRAALEDLDRIGEAGGAHSEKIRTQIAQALELFAREASEIGEGAMATFASLSRQSEEFRSERIAGDNEAIAQIERRADALGALLKSRHDQLHAIEQQATSAMHERMAAFLEESEALLARLAQERQAGSARIGQDILDLEARLTEAVQRIGAIDEAAMACARDRLAALSQEAERLDAQVARSQSGFDGELIRRQEAAQQQQAEALAALEERLAAFDARLRTRGQTQIEHLAGLVGRSEQLAARLEQIDETMAGLIARLADGETGLGTQADRLAARLGQSRSLLEESGASMAAMTNESGRLLELIEAGARQTRGALGEALGEAEARLVRFHTEAGEIGALIQQAEDRGALLAGHIEAAREHGSGTLGTLQQLEAQLDEVAAKSTTLARQAREELQGAIDLLAMRSANVLQDLRAGQTKAIAAIAEQLAQQANGAIASALEERSHATIASLEEAARRAAEAGQRTTADLHDQLAKVSELTGNLEQRVARARERAEESVDNDFSRRMALITEALHSGAIDISRAFDNDVTDTQWASYLRGDRGIFTRRAVTLLDKHKARAVYDLYQEDREFRETVNRYVHDFEAMLRTVLSTRDGSAIAVTLLSSDIGKLYVAMAQAIERLRD